MSNVLVVGLNPAWQQIVTLPSLVPGAVCRATRCEEFASGKGLNAARALARLGHRVSLLQVLAGDRGARIAAECEARGIRSLAVTVPGETRTCVTLLHGGQTTEIVNPFSVPPGDAATLGDRLLAQLPDAGRPDALLVCGSTPAGLSPGLHTEIVARVREAAGDETLILWDSVAGLTRDALARIDWLKINAGEYAALAPAPDDVAARVSVLITDGAAPATARLSGIPWTCHLPPLDAVVNPIGAGDAATAALADALLRGLGAREAAGRALAAASASCLETAPASWDPGIATRIEAALRWERP